LNTKDTSRETDAPTAAAPRQSTPATDALWTDPSTLGAGSFVVMAGKAKPKKHTAKSLAAKADAALTNRGGGAAGKQDRLGGAAGHAKYKCPTCGQAAPSEKSAIAHWDSKHSKFPFVFSDWTDAHAAVGGVTTQGAGVKGGKSKTVHELQKTEAGRAELARRQAEKERVSNLNF
jgi:hypothetical protein